MAEEGNCMLYHKEIHNNLKNKVPFVPYLGFFLTQVVHQMCHQNMCNKQRLRRKGAILNHYKILTSLTIPSSGPYKEYNSSFSCPNGDSLHFNNPVGWSTAQSQVIPDISYSDDDASDACNINGDSFSHEVRQFDKRCASLPHLNLIRGAFTTHSLSGSLHAPSEYSTSSFTHSNMALSYSRVESLDLCGPNNETQHSRSVSHKMSASLCSLSPEHEMNIQLAGSHSATALHQVKDCDTSNRDEYHHLLGLSYLTLDSSSVSPSTDSPSPVQSRCSSPGAGTSTNDEPSSWYGDYRFHSAKSSSAASNVEEHKITSNHLGNCSIIGHRNAIHLDFRDTKDPKVLLMMYQMSSLGCGIEIKERVSIGNIMTDYCFDTEAENYELSYQREPTFTCTEALKESL